MTEERCIPLADQTKAPKEGFNNHQNTEKHERPEATEAGNYGVHLGRRLLILDIDDYDGVPDWLLDLPPTLTVGTPHGGEHRYYVVEDENGVDNKDLDGGELRYDGLYVVGPDSELDHSVACKDGKDGCPGDGVDEYVITENQPIARLEGESLDEIREICDDSTSTTRTKSNAPVDSIEEPDEVRAERETEWLCTEFLPKQAGKVVEESLLDILKGGRGNFDWRRSNDPSSLDRSNYDYHALQMLYGAFLDRGDDEAEARRNALAVFKHFCLEHEWDETRNRRKWLTRGERYLQNTMESVQKEFDRGTWLRRVRREYEDGFDPDEHQPWRDLSNRGPSDITEDTVAAAVWLLSGPFTTSPPIEGAESMFGLDLHTPPPTVHKYVPPGRRQADDDKSSGTYRERRYPTANEVGGFAAELNPDRSEKYFKEVLRELARGEGRYAGMVARAECPSRPSGHRHVYYWADNRDPDDAEYVKIDGEKLEPGTREPFYEERDDNEDGDDGSSWTNDLV